MIPPILTKDKAMITDIYDFFYMVPLQFLNTLF